MENLVCHYTSLDALRNIMGKELCLWATHYSHLNDPSEHIWAEQYVIESIKKEYDFQHDSFLDIKGWFGKEPYILSLSRKMDDRNMWRLYCNDGKGVCLVLDEDILKDYCRQLTYDNPENLFCIVENVEYSTKEDIGKAIEKCKANINFDIVTEEQESLWMRMVPFIKNADYDIEAEVRCAILRETKCISIPYDETTKGPGKLSFCMNNSNRKYRMRGEDLVPYIELKLPTKILKRIILGYRVKEKEANEYITNIIQYSGSKYKDLKTEKSNLFSSYNQKEYNKDNYITTERQ